jgi:hypothetical protein
MSGLPITFRDDVELIEFAEKFIINDRINSLENDVERCLPVDKKEAAEYAPFPALMYCFSIIDLLGSLYAGDARSGNTTHNSARYMEDYMKYPKDKLRLLQKIYRHKIVYLSQPKYAMEYNNQTIGWRHDEDNRSKHLTIEQIPCYAPTDPFDKIYCDASYIVSIKALKDDIKDSVTRYPDGYMEHLKNDADLKERFKTAINEIYDPKVTH